jgi:hypothetical protein
MNSARERSASLLPFTTARSSRTINSPWQMSSSRTTTWIRRADLYLKLGTPLEKKLIMRSSSPKRPLPSTLTLHKWGIKNKNLILKETKRILRSSCFPSLLTTGSLPRGSEGSPDSQSSSTESRTRRTRTTSSPSTPSSSTSS